MRVTNMMMQNNMLLNINKNASKTNDLYGQIATGKKITLASQDPIIASRALRFRASISQNEQYTRNNDQAISWTTTTATSFSNVTSQLENISSLLTQGANDTLSLSERKDIATSLNAYLEEIEAQMNTTYSGRYVFSGYRTDEPAVLTGTLNEAYNINQTLSYDDILSTKSYWKQDSQTMAEMEESVGIRLPYAFCENIAITDLDGNSAGFNIIHRSTNGYVTPADPNETATPAPTATDPLNPYANIGANDVIYIEETGELLLGENAQAALLNGELNINYDKENFLKGEINPKVYFECTQIETPITVVPGGPTNTLDFDPATGIFFGGSNTPIQKTDQNGDPVVDASGNPVYISYTMEDQDMMSYELSYKTHIQINSLGKDVLTDNLYSDLSTSIAKVLDMEISSASALKLKYSQAPYNLSGDELQEAIDEQISKETTQLQAIIQDEFTAILDQIENHASQVSREQTDLASRQVRLDVIQVRLEDEFLNLSTLMSNNEDVDYEEAIVNLNMVQAVYDASLQITAKITQMSLLNYM